MYSEVLAGRVPAWRRPLAASVRPVITTPPQARQTKVVLSFLARRARRWEQLQ